MRFDGRRSAVDWTAAPDVTESEAGSAAIEAWLARRPDSPGESEWADVLDRLRREMSRLIAHPLVGRDPVCRTILGGLDARSSLAEIDAAVDALGRRVEVLLAPAPKPPAPPRPAVPSPPPASRLQVLREFLRL